MRLLPIILIILAPVISRGQAFWFGARGGALFNNAPSGIPDDYFKNVEGGTGWLAGATASVEIKPWLQIGIGFDRVERNFSYESPLRFKSGDAIYSNRYEANSRATSGYVFANYRYAMKRSFAYAGLHFGDYQALGDPITAYRSDKPDSGFHAGSSGFSPGPFMGAQAGYGYCLGSSWYLQAEVAARYRPQAGMFVLTENAKGQIDHVGRNTSFMYYPVVLSINYRLHTGRHKPIDIPKAETPEEEPETKEEQ
ncbi:hypothetical protein [Polluticoccus soli]|uniref:hypothetical protein n=1 Tax=Polluticoccus soli TaxID=3034150 RepID=UPI0023E1C236|nr:hypothetical protein [Flavipsychrobacter sp. JY13-12]